jgi:hypothetical protein
VGRLDEEGAAVKAYVILALLLLAPRLARAHVGSPDVFFDGKVGPYPAQIVIRMPPVVPGRAQIEVRAQTQDALTVSSLPLYSQTAVKNAPPAEPAQPVTGEPGLYRGELWLMSMGAYTIEVRVAGASGEGTARIPVNSVATHQLPLPPYLRTILLTLGGLLTFGGLAIVYAAAGESVLASGATMQRADRKKGLLASAIAAIVLALGLAGGWHWWQVEEQHFRRNLRAGAWPDLNATVETSGSQRILHLIIGEKTFNPNYALPLIPDHGKLVHLFLIREPGHDVFAHVHPIRRAGKNFDLLLPPLPEGDYRIFSDLTFGDTGLSFTASTAVHVPAAPTESAAEPRTTSLTRDPDDSWFIAPWGALTPSPDFNDSNSDVVCTLPGGAQAIWKAKPQLQARHDAHLEFVFRDASGQPLPLEPYMGMMSHAAILRNDGAVFAHLHPTGNFSMAAQSYFATKIAREASKDGKAAPPEIDHSKMHHGSPNDPPPVSITIPYEFPSPGDYHIWAQVKTGGQVLTAHFEATVAP